MYERVVCWVENCSEDVCVYCSWKGVCLVGSLRVRVCCWYLCVYVPVNVYVFVGCAFMVCSVCVCVFG